MGRISEGPPPAPVSLADVAAMANVSIATASKALNNRPGISTATRDNIRRIAASMDYVPQGGTRSGRNGINGIGVILMTLGGSFAHHIVLGIEDGAAVDASSVLLSSSARGVMQAQSRLRALLSRRIDGIVVIADSTNPIPPIALESPVPIVYAYGASENPEDISFVPDNYTAGRLLGEHLVQSGRRKIAMVNGDPTFDASHDRARGLRHALNEAGLELVGRDPTYGSWSEVWGRQGTTTLLNSGADIDAIVAGSDRVALGVIDVLRAEGRRIPHDVAVAGFDNWDELAMNSWPPLTTVDMRLYELGRQAAASLSDLILGTPVAPGLRTLPVRLIQRESTATFGTL